MTGGGGRGGCSPFHFLSMACDSRLTIIRVNFRVCFSRKTHANNLKSNFKVSNNSFLMSCCSELDLPCAQRYHG